MELPKAVADRVYRRIALAEDLHFTWSDHLLTVASSRWPPGIFIYDLEYLTVAAAPGRRGGMKVTIGSRGAQIQYQVLRFDIEDDAYARFEEFVAAMREHRELMRASAR